MSPEMTVLGVVTLFYLFAWLSPLLAKAHVYGYRWLASDHSTQGLPPLPLAAKRAVRAYADLKACYPAFAVAVLLLAFTGGFTRFTALAAWVFLAVRLLHLPAAILGMPLLRGFSWLLGWLATLYLLIMALVVLL